MPSTSSIHIKNARQDQRSGRAIERSFAPQSKRYRGSLQPNGELSLITCLARSTAVADRPNVGFGDLRLPRALGLDVSPTFESPSRQQTDLPITTFDRLNVFIIDEKECRTTPDDPNSAPPLGAYVDLRGELAEIKRWRPKFTLGANPASIARLRREQGMGKFFQQGFQPSLCGSDRPTVDADNLIELLPNRPSRSK